MIPPSWRRPALLTLVVALLSTGTAAAAVGYASPQAKAKPKPVPRLRLEGGPWGYPQPFSYVRGPGLVHVGFSFDTLLWKDSTGRVIPWLATSWSRSRDGLTYRFTLRRGVRWHDGQPLTARDVAFTFDYSRTGPGRLALGINPSLEFIKDVSAPSGTTVVFRLATRYAPFPVSIAGRVPIIPQHIWKDVSDPAKFRGPQAVVGSGPYRLADYQESTGSYRYVANTRFFLGTPVVRSLEFVPTSDSLLALRRGDLDGGGASTEEGLAPGILRPFYNRNFGILRAPGEWTRSLHFNLTKGFPYDNRSFRQAVAYAINRPELVRRILFGAGRAGSMGILAPSNPWTAKGLPTYAHNPVRARSLLGAIGLVDRNGDGMRDLPGGDPFKPELTTSTFQSPLTAEVVREYLRAVGLDVQLRSLDRAGSDAATAAGRYEMALIGFGGLGGEPDTLRTMLSARVRSRSFTRVHGYENARFEELAAAQIQTVNQRKRREQLAEMQRIVARDVPVISLYVPTRVHVYRKSVFSSWYYTPGGVWGGYPGPLNKHAFVTGKKVGL